MALDSSLLVQAETEEQDGGGCKGCLKGFAKGACFVLDIAAFLYVLYATSLFFIVVLMWAFSILITIYVSISSGQTWAQIFAVSLGLPLIGPIVNVLDESFIALVRTLRIGFQSRFRPHVMTAILLPSTYPDEIAYRQRQEPNSDAKWYQISLQLNRGYVWVCDKIEPLGLTTQRVVTAAFLLTDFITIIVFYANEVSHGLAGRAFVCLLVMLLCSVVRFIRSCPTPSELESRLHSSRSLRFVKYCVIAAAFFTFSSTTASGLWSNRPDVYQFTLSAFGFYALVLGAIFIIVIFVCPTVVSCLSCLGGADRSQDDSYANRLPGELEVLSVKSKSTLVVSAFLCFLGIIFVFGFVSRGAGAGTFDDQVVSSQHRWISLFVWLAIAIFSFAHSISDATYEEIHGTNAYEKLRRNESTASVVSMQNEPNATRTASSNIQLESPTRKIVPDSVDQTSVSRRSARLFVGTITALFFLLVSEMTSLNFASTLPATTRSYDYSILSERKVPYTLCSSHWGSGDRFNMTDLVLIAKAAYYDSTDEVDQALRLWFNEPLNTTRTGVNLGNSSTFSASGVHAFHIIFQATNRTIAAGLPAGEIPAEWQLNNVSLPRIDVVAVRGSHNGLDWLQDAYVWSDSIFFSVFDKISPFSLPQDVVNFLVRMSKSLRYGVFGDISYFRQLKELTASVIEEAEASGNGQVIIVGHSLGGGLAQLVGSALGIDAFAVSGVGVGYQAAAADFTVDNVRGFQSNIVPASDIVPQIDLQIGDVQNIACSASPNPGACHSLATTWTEVAKSCGDIRDTTDIEGKPSAIVSEAITQFIIWLTITVVMVLCFQYRVVKTAIRFFNVVEKRTINQNVLH